MFEKGRGLKEYNRGGELVQSTLYVCIYRIIAMKPLVPLMLVNKKISEKNFTKNKKSFRALCHPGGLAQLISKLHSIWTREK
jgi:hypothetical protein